MKHKRDFKELEKRRLKGARLLLRGVTKAEVARQLGVTRQTVATWEQRLAEGGREALKRGDLGRPRQLDAEQERELGKIILAGALAAGFPTELWTLPRIGKVIAKRFGVEYSTGHLWRLLRRLGFSCQKPEKRALQRNEAEIARWKRHTWPALKKKPRREDRTIVFIDESGLSERPSVARTWSLRGQTPILQHSFTWKQLSAIAGLSFWQFYFRFFPGAIRSEQIIEFLGALRRQIKQPLLIIWDGVATHRSRLVKAWREEQDGQIAVARLPPYAPELNPVEAIWAYLKKHEIANLCLATIGEVGQFARNRLKSMQRRPNLVVAFWKQAELAF
ncbi:MAG: IS630 family transposase [Rhodocyclaceae bacterium]|nr:IS630 family transposase [Rhodocyclaceae bacterium]